MKKEYCLLERNIFVRIVSIEEYDKLRYTENFCYDIPPIIPEGNIAIRDNDMWVVKRESHVKKLESREKKKFRDAVKEKINMRHLKEHIHKKYEELPPYIQHKFFPNYIIISKLKKEQTLLQNKLINLYENKKRILKKLKIYKKDLDNKIIELESIKNEQTSIPLTANNEFQIIDVVPSKVDF